MKLYKSNRQFTVDGKKKAIEFAEILGYKFVTQDRNLLIFLHPLMTFEIKFGYPNELGIFGNLLHVKGIEQGREQLRNELKSLLNV